METDPLVSIIVPVYNVEPFLDRCIKSLIGQSYNNIEIVLVDDGSTDSSGNRCDWWATKDARIISSHKANGGLSDARNHGIDLASGEWLTFVDSDDYVEPDYVHDLLALVVRYPEASIGACAHYILRNNAKKISSKLVNKPICVSHEDAFESALYGGYVDVCAWAKIYRTHLFSDTRFPKGRLYEDTAIFGKLLNKTKCFAYTPRPLYNYVIRTGSIVNSPYSNKRLEYIDASKCLVEEALKCSEGLTLAGVRKLNQARLSVLRYMAVRADKQERSVRKQLRNDVLEDASMLLADKLVPTRDKIAIILLRAGFPIYSIAWRVYERLR